MSTQANEFIEWLNEKERSKNWSDYELSKRAGISHSVLSRARSGILPKWDACESIANALDVSPILVFRMAGLLPPGLPDEVLYDDWKDVLSRLSERDQDVLKRTALSMLDADKKSNAKTRLKGGYSST